jgi:hypothetical protein
LIQLVAQDLVGDIYLPNSICGMDVSGEERTSQMSSQRWTLAGIVALPSAFGLPF